MPPSRRHLYGRSGFQRELLHTKLTPIQTPDLSPEAFIVALAQGRGLAALILQSGDPARYADALLTACVENLQFDRQCEANRASYMMRLLELADLKRPRLGRQLAR